MSTVNNLTIQLYGIKTLIADIFVLHFTLRNRAWTLGIIHPNARSG